MCESCLLYTSLVDLFDKWTGRVHKLQSLAFHEFIDLPAYAVGTDDDHAFFQGFQFLLRIDDLYALLFQILHHLFIVDDGTVGCLLYTSRCV